MKAKFINEYINWKGEWILDKKEDPFDKSRDYYYREELLSKILDLIKDYKSKLKDKDILEILQKLERKFTH